MPLYNWSQTAASNATADATINYAEGQAPSSLNDSARAAMAAVAKYRDDISGSIVTGGTSTAYTITSNSSFDTLAHMNGQMIAFSPHTNCGATVTLNVDSLGAKPLRSSPGVELAANALISGAPYVATYNNSDGAFYLRNFYGLPTNISISGTLGVTGASTFTSGTFSTTLGVIGNFSVNTNKFTVAASTGNTVIAGTLAVTGVITSTARGGLSIGPGGTGANNSVISLEGESGAQGGTLLNFKKNGTGYWYVGDTSAVFGGGGNHFLIYNETTVPGTMLDISDTDNSATFSGAILSKSASGGVGYVAGAGGAVTQLTSRTTGVTINTPTGAITLFSAGGSGSVNSFTVTNSAVAATDTVVVSVQSATNLYQASVTAVGSGSFKISFSSISGTATDAPVFNFAVIKGAAS